MRFIIIALFLTLNVSLADASCQVFVPVKEFDNSGLSIRFDFTKLFSEKGYTEVYSNEEADYALVVEGSETESTFHKAIGVFQMGDLLVEESVTCYTQWCGISDFGKAFNRAYKKFSNKLKVCSK